VLTPPPPRPRGAPEALRAHADCTVAELDGRRDADWVTVGGIITAVKRIRTRKGDPMVFATLDDLEGAVEMLIFGNALGEADDAVSVDRVVLVRGRVDHKDAAKTALIAQAISAFEPSEEEIVAARARAAAAPKRPPSLCLSLDAAVLPASVIDELKLVLANFPGESEVVLEMRVADAVRRLKLGPDFRVSPTASLRAELAHLLGAGMLAA